MATFTDIPNSDVDPGSPLSTALMTALRDNTEAQLGRGQTWQNVSGSRAYTTVYQNTTAFPIAVSVVMFQPSATGSGTAKLFVSSDNVTFIEVARAEGGASVEGSVTTIVPPDHYYKVTQTDPDFAIVVWAELRP